MYSTENFSNSQNHILPVILMKINGKNIRALFDSGASVSYLRESVMNSYGLTPLQNINLPKAKAANQSTFKFITQCRAIINIGNIKFIYYFYVTVDNNCPYPCLIGADFMKKLNELGNNISLEFHRNKILIGESEIPLVAFIATQQNTGENKYIKNNNSNFTAVIAPTEIILEPRTDNLIIGTTEYECPSQLYITHPPTHFSSEFFLVGRTIVKPGPLKFIKLRIMNPSQIEIKIKPGEVIAFLESINDQDEIINIKFKNEFNENDQNNISQYKPIYSCQTNLLIDHEFLKGINLEKSILSIQSKEKLKEIICKYKHVFTEKSDYKGSIKHDINLEPGKGPIASRQYRVPMTMKEEIKKQVEQMLKDGIIEHSNSQFASPVVLVKKKDGSMRFAIDYRKLNSITIKQVYHLPLINEIREEVSGKKIFTSFDFKSGFHQLPMNPEHKERTAFSCWMGLFQFIKVPFGLCGAPSTFMRAMNELKKYISSSFLIYIDDVILSSNNEIDHLIDIEQFLSVISNFGMRLKLDKCEFGLSEIKYLGFFISEKGIRPDPKDLESIDKINPPTNLKELRAFLGAVNYFRRFIPECAKILGPLYELTKENNFKSSKDWNEEEWEAFKLIKNKLKTPPVLAPPNPKESYIIETDASIRGIGAVLIQNKHPVAYFSRTLKDTEKRYHINELEALAIEQALKEFSIYILGTGTTIIKTDNSPICAILTRKDLTGRLARFQLAIQSYDIKIIHRSGKSNQFADYLSRHVNVVTRSKARANYISSSESEDENYNNTNKSSNNSKISLDKIINLQKMCPELLKIISALKGYFPQNKKIKEQLEEKY
uniref:RNA-directed DNA polymerase n=1 Tax=Meloidogyne enterolobii TaxID=390850 RepID=A0A6V7WMG1_MELEN|nr:unnamed protein product [Meloidogyne enterolobii]